MWKLRENVMEVPVLSLIATIFIVFKFVLFFQVLGKANIIVEWINKKQIMANVNCVRLTHTEYKAYSKMVTIL